MKKRLTADQLKGRIYGWLAVGIAILIIVNIVQAWP